MPARNRAEPNSEGGGGKKMRQDARGRGMQVKPSRKNSVTHSEDLGLRELRSECAFVCVCVKCVCVFEGLTALSFSCNYLRAGTTANPTRPSNGNTFLPPAPAPCANYV